MKLTIDPMPAIKATAKNKIDQHFSSMSAGTQHRDRAHASKRLQAQNIISGGEPTFEFSHEAELRKISVVEFANMILNKPDLFAQRELLRQKIMFAIEAAKSPAEIDDIISGNWHNKVENPVILELDATSPVLKVG